MITNKSFQAINCTATYHRKQNTTYTLSTTEKQKNLP